MEDLNDDILEHLQNVLDECNPYIRSFRQVRDLIMSNATAEISMLTHSNRRHDPHRYNAPTSPDIATIMIGDEYTFLWYMITY